MHARPPDDTAAEATIPRRHPISGPNPFRETREEPPEPPGPRHAAPGPSAWRWFVGIVGRPLFVFIAVGIIAAVPRFYHLSDPHARVFDEVYYTKDGCLYAGYPYKQCDLDAPDEQAWVHPPFGKWMIAGGIRMFGNTQFGWRVSAAFIGTLTVVLISMLAFVLWRSALWAFVAGLLGATESLLVVQSRTALLDIFEAFWVLAAFVFLVLDKGWIERRTPVVVPDWEPDPGGGAWSALPNAGPGPPAGWSGRPDRRPGAGMMLRNGSSSPWLSGPVPTTQFASPDEPSAPLTLPSPPAAGRAVAVPSPFWRPWRVAAGVAFGFAIAVKWSALAAVLGAIVLEFFWERTRRHRAGVRSRRRQPVAFEFQYGLRLAGGFLALAALAVGALGHHLVVGLVALVILLGVVAWEEVEVRRAGAHPPIWAGPVVVLGVAGMAVALHEKAYLVALLLAAVALVAWLIERVAHLRSRILGPLWHGAFQETFPMLVCLFLLPLVVYLFTYSGRIERAPYPPYRYRPGLGYSWMAHPSRLGDLTFQMAKFHHGLNAEVYDSGTKTYTPAHPYQSRPWSWIFMGRPVAYFYKASDEGKPQERRREVLGIGNPAIFWVQLFAIPWLAVMWRRRRDWRAGLILLAILFQYLFWFLPDISLQKVQFFFYATPIAPFFVLAAVYLVRDLAHMRLYGSYSRPFLPISVGYVVVSVALFLWFWPVLCAAPLTVGQWQARMWFRGWV